MAAWRHDHEVRRMNRLALALMILYFAAFAGVIGIVLWKIAHPIPSLIP